VDIFDASDYDYLVPRRAKKTIAWALLIGVAWVPPVKAGISVRYRITPNT
jgi:hypothetical protein